MWDAGLDLWGCRVGEEDIKAGDIRILSRTKPHCDISWYLHCDPGAVIHC